MHAYFLRTVYICFYTRFIIPFRVLLSQDSGTFEELPSVNPLFIDVLRCPEKGSTFWAENVDLFCPKRRRFHSNRSTLFAAYVVRLLYLMRKTPFYHSRRAAAQLITERLVVMQLLLRPVS